MLPDMSAKYNLYFFNPVMTWITTNSGNTSRALTIQPMVAGSAIFAQMVGWFNRSNLHINLKLFSTFQDNVQPSISSSGKKYISFLKHLKYEKQ